GGELSAEYMRLAPTLIADRRQWRNDSLRTQLARWAGLEDVARAVNVVQNNRFVRSSLPAGGYIKSISSAKLIELLPPEAPVITHVHELGFVFHQLASASLEELFRKTRRFVACCSAVRNSLIACQQLNRERIETVHESIPVAQIRAQRNREE